MSAWSSGICGCFEDMSICATSYFCPCIVAGKNAEAMGESCLLYGCLSTMGCVGIFFGAKIRERVRQIYAIEGSFGHDCLMHWFCPVCAYAQEAREIKSRALAGATIVRS
ncbi:protein PLANT CADMIUM RESISTANCE 10 [Exaiptasia diaphana]|uniref:Uncharacterized protein n=1 Tax=Exaiptasia diaphana TaxID=2652724 RepID=A0A913YAA1_EXADI|nr:protein PLANT CADMIUM RESISTANCE 10 [Exaiptasia diaphana]KXJ19586.1 Protein PLANT CADMIUM RESISTANCE 10 [Exaiptasia diaphana]